MKQPTVYLFLATLLNLSTFVQADQIDMIIDMSVKQMKQDSDFSEMTQCLSISESTFITALTKTMRHCFEKHGMDENTEDAMGQCFKSQSLLNLKIPEDIYNKCEEQFPDDEDSNNSDYSDQNSDPFEGMTEQQVKQEIAAQQAQGKQQLEQMANMLKGMSQGTESVITLPIFQPSEIVSHFTSGMNKQNGQKTLPVATFSTTQPLAKVVDFYKKSLSNFEINYGTGDVYTVMKKIPKNLMELSFDLKNLPLYSVPHIEIYSLNIKGMTKTTIVIVYKK